MIQTKVTLIAVRRRARLCKSVPFKQWLTCKEKNTTVDKLTRNLIRKVNNHRYEARYLILINWQMYEGREATAARNIITIKGNKTKETQTQYIVLYAQL